MNGKITRNPIAMAEDESLSLTFIDPTRPVEIVSHNLVAGGFYGIGLDSGRIPGETIEQSSDRYSQAYKTENLYVNGLLNEKIMGEALYFSSINWLYQTDAAEKIAESLLQVVSTRQAEMMSELSTQRDWLFGMPTKVSITGIRVDVGRDTSVVSPIDGNNTRIKRFMTLTLYNGSVNEHLDLDIPLGTNTAVSAIKAIQISHQQGIPIYHITSNNINSILPILQVGSDVQTDIQNSVNAGYEVTVPEREITYAGWQGVGYIIQDPTTGAGACLITGGAAGAETLITEGYYVTLHEKFLEYSALVIEGEGESWLEELWVPYWNTEYNAMMAVGAIYRLGYLPIHKRITTKEWYLSQISYNCWKILYHVGHGASGSLLLDGNTRESVTTNEIAGSSTDFLFVYIDACHSAEGICQAFSSTALGWQGSVAWRYAYWFEAAFWLECLNGESVGEARRIAKDLADKIVEWLPGPKGDPEVFGDESIILSLER